MIVYHQQLAIASKGSAYRVGRVRKYPLVTNWQRIDDRRLDTLHVLVRGDFIAV
jgi:hypothetical protein